MTDANKDLRVVAVCARCWHRAEGHSTDEDPHEYGRCLGAGCGCMEYADAAKTLADAREIIKTLHAALERRNEAIGEYFAADAASDAAELAERRALRKVGDRDEPPQEELDRLAVERMREVHRWKMARERLLTDDVKRTA